MNDSEMTQMFGNVLKQLEEANKNIGILVNSLAQHSDLIAQNNEINENLKKTCFHLGSVMAQGLSGNLNVQALEKGANFFLKLIGK